MKAVVFENIRTATVKDVPIPGISPNDVLIRVERVGICGIDVCSYQGDSRCEFPLIAGHEFSGIVTDIGEHVTTVAVEERVTAAPNIGCGICEFCKRQQENHCENLQMIGVTRDGAFAEYVVVPEHKVFPIGDMDFREAAMLEPIARAIYGLQRLSIPIGAEMLIFGAGPTGLILSQLMKLRGASRVVMVEKLTRRLKLAQTLGANQVVEANGQEIEALKELSPIGFDVVIDATGVSQVLEKIPPLIRNGGELLCFGNYSKEAPIQIAPYEIRQREISIYGASFAHRNSFMPAIRLLQNGSIRIEPLLSHSFPLEQFEMALDVMRSGESMKIQLEP